MSIKYVHVLLIDSLVVQYIYMFSSAQLWSIYFASLPLLSSVHFTFSLSCSPVRQVCTRLCLRETPRKTSKLSNPARAQACVAEADLAPPCSCACLISNPNHSKGTASDSLDSKSSWHHKILLTSSPPVWFPSSFFSQIMMSQPETLSCKGQES